MMCVPDTYTMFCGGARGKPPTNNAYTIHIECAMRCYRVDWNCFWYNVHQIEILISGNILLLQTRVCAAFIREPRSSFYTKKIAKMLQIPLYNQLQISSPYRSTESFVFIILKFEYFNSFCSFLPMVVLKVNKITQENEIESLPHRGIMMRRTRKNSENILKGKNQHSYIVSLKFVPLQRSLCASSEILSVGWRI